MARQGILISAPASGCGKTLVTLALLRLLARRGIPVTPAKSGPDYIDPGFHRLASGHDSVNLDAYAMQPSTILRLAGQGDGLLAVEGAMGLFDGAANGRGSAAALAQMLGLPVILVVDCARQAQSVAALVRGFATHDPSIGIGGLILNRVGSQRHEAMLRTALEPLAIPVLAALPAEPSLAIPSRHLGLVRAQELDADERLCDRAADWLEVALDLDGLLDVSRRASMPAGDGRAPRLPPPGGRVAVARDDAFAFAYPHLLGGWREAGADISFFSPLADEAPDIGADAVYLPGGYPELHAGRIAGASAFRAGMTNSAMRGALVYGECGGYMVLGDGLVDGEGTRHAMLGMLPLETSFEVPRRHLGYRQAVPTDDAPFWAAAVTAHEFHYASILSEGDAGRLFRATDATGQALGALGLYRGRVMGSFLHVIDGAA
ncbi:cobyrinate a,c-diamide synthase [Aureimonas sp. OT7]|uniref:cobyrinate a,c-diamide synthase n=1 Tax=Aureimonas sp. OT7 TaxID=2816454 RepID=UPI001780E997|nr:cobyrinate a,c-diamide synthase [Aureimonas sp. OT7]QOG06636.1 cobyrinate a,c-diamide synthase [Aureimonas sp. OT7]